jgi:PAS domain S-box-containing protein
VLTEPGPVAGSAVTLSAGNGGGKAEDVDARTLLACIVQSSDDAIISETLDGFITSWNNAAERIFGYSAREAVGKNIAIIELAGQNGKDDDLEQISRGQRIDHYRTLRRHKDGTYIDIWLTVSAIRDPRGEVMGASLVARDITDVKRAENELRQLTETLRQRNAELLQSNQELDSFAYIASHDLKEPLRGIHNYATFLLEDYGQLLETDGRNKLETLKVLAERMYSLIDSLLEFSRVGRVNLAIKKTDLNVVLDDVLQSLKILIDEQDVRIKVVRPLPKIECDHVRIGEVFRNLVTNAIKYNDKPDKWIEIAWRTSPALRTGADEDPVRADRSVPIVFTVRDNGIGIHDRHFESIFRIFKRLHGRDKFGGGTGVGLTIVKKIVERHGGRIWVESSPGEGTTFSFILGEEDVCHGGPASDSGG